MIQIIVRNKDLESAFIVEEEAWPKFSDGMKIKALEMALAAIEREYKAQQCREEGHLTLLPETSICSRCLFYAT